MDGMDGIGSLCGAIVWASLCDANNPEISKSGCIEILLGALEKKVKFYGLFKLEFKFEEEVWLDQEQVSWIACGQTCLDDLRLRNIFPKPVSIHLDRENILLHNPDWSNSFWQSRFFSILRLINSDGFQYKGRRDQYQMKSMKLRSKQWFRKIRKLWLRKIRKCLGKCLGKYESLKCFWLHHL